MLYYYASKDDVVVRYRARMRYTKHAAYTYFILFVKLKLFIFYEFFSA